MYKGPQGEAETTAHIEGNKVVMVSKGSADHPEDGVKTERYVENGKLFQVITHMKTGGVWKRQCKQIA